MFCPKCGEEFFEDDSQFCGKCGASLRNDAQNSTCTLDAAQTTQTQQPAPKKSKRIPAIIAGAIAVAAIAVGAFVMIGNAGAETVHAVPMTVQADEYSTDDGASRVPVQVTGTDAEGNAVDELHFVDARGNGLFLPDGEYTLSIPASPITSGGHLYKVPADEINVSIGKATYAIEDSESPEPGEGDAPSGAKVAQPITGADERIVTLDPLPAIDADDTIVENAFEYASKDPQLGKDNAETLKGAALANHEQAVKDKEAEEAAAKAEEERKAAEAAARNYYGTYFNITPPESFGTVTYEVSGGSRDDILESVTIRTSNGEEWGVMACTPHLYNDVTTPLVVGDRPDGIRVCFTKGTDAEAYNHNQVLAPYVSVN